MTDTTVSIEELIAAARALIEPGERHILGLAGAPGSGKSTLSALLVEALGDDAVVVGLDAFHLSDTVLHTLGRHDRKGAPDTFDPAGYTHLLKRLRSREDDVVYVAAFDRDLEDSIAATVAVHRDVPLIITEGNYLLLDDEAWKPIRGLLDESWYVDPGEDVRLERLIARHERHGRSPEEARERSHGSDQRNAEVIAASRANADRIVTLAPETQNTERKAKP